jgi:hypothetical protein
MVRDSQRSVPAYRSIKWSQLCYLDAVRNSATYESRPQLAHSYANASIGSFCAALYAG